MEIIEISFAVAAAVAAYKGMTLLNM